MSGSLVICGNVVLDILVRPVSDPLHWGATTLVDGIAQHLGGNAGSTSYTAAKLGTPVTILTLVGRDAAADCVLARLREAGVDTSLTEWSEAPTSTAVSLVNSDGERALLYHLGASGVPFRNIFALPPDARSFHLAAVFRMEHLRSMAPEVLRNARACGLATSADTQWDHHGEWLDVLAPSLPYIDLLFVNEDEERKLGGRQRLRSLCAGTIVVKLGAAGCLVCPAEGDEIAVPGFAVRVIDTTGAGDCFVGGFLAAMHRGWGLQDAARFANAVGALAVQQLGATEGVVSFENTIAWMNLRSKFP